MQEVNTLRNRWLGHAGIRSDRESETHVEQLLAHLVALQQLMNQSWRRATLVYPGDSQFRSGRHCYSVRRLSGLSVPFENVDIDLGEPMEADRLHIYFTSDRTALELVPIVRMAPAPESARDSFYYFSRVADGDRVRMVSYHHPDTPELFIDDSDMVRFLSGFP